MEENSNGKGIKYDGDTHGDGEKHANKSSEES